MEQITITRTHLGLQLGGQIPPLSQDDVDTVRYALNSLSFLIPRNQTITLPQWCEAIKASYDTNTPQISAVVSCLERIDLLSAQSDALTTGEHHHERPR